MADEKDKGQEKELNNLYWKEVAERLNVDIKTGLTEEEAQKRTSKFGFNEIPEKKESPIIKFLKKLWGLTAWMLELTMLVSFILGKYLDL